jgi:hypothetical protein
LFCAAVPDRGSRRVPIIELDGRGDYRLSHALTALPGLLSSIIECPVDAETVVLAAANALRDNDLKSSAQLFICPTCAHGMATIDGANNFCRCLKTMPAIVDVLGTLARTSCQFVYQLTQSRADARAHTLHDTPPGPGPSPSAAGHDDSCLQLFDADTYAALATNTTRKAYLNTVDASCRAHQTKYNASLQAIEDSMAHTASARLDLQHTKIRLSGGGTLVKEVTDPRHALHPDALAALRQDGVSVRDAYAILKRVHPDAIVSIVSDEMQLEMTGYCSDPRGSPLANKKSFETWVKFFVTGNNPGSFAAGVLCVVLGVTCG